MNFILSASSLYHAIKTLPQAFQEHNRKALPGLSLRYAVNTNPNAVKVRKTAQFQLNDFYRDKKRLVIWLDVVNNSKSSKQQQ